MLEPHDPNTFVAVSIGPRVDPVAVRLALVPFSNVAVLIGAPPNAVALFDALKPFAVVDFTIFPGVYALSVGLALLEEA